MRNTHTPVKFKLIGLLLSVALVYLFISDMKSSMVYNLTMVELAAAPEMRTDQSEQTLARELILRRYGLRKGTLRPCPGGLKL